MADTFDRECAAPQKPIDDVTGVTYRAESIIALLLKEKIPLSRKTLAALSLVHDRLTDLIDEEWD